MSIKYLKKIYNFSYRLSGSKKLAERLTEKYFLKSRNLKNDVMLLKQVWKDFQKYSDGHIHKEGDLIQKILLSISPELRCTIILRDIMGYSYEEIATVLDKTHWEVAHLIAEGRRELIKANKLTNIS